MSLPALGIAQPTGQVRVELNVKKVGEYSLDAYHDMHMGVHNRQARYMHEKYLRERCSATHMDLNERFVSNFHPPNGARRDHNHLHQWLRLRSPHNDQVSKLSSQSQLTDAVEGADFVTRREPLVHIATTPYTHLNGNGIHAMAGGWKIVACQFNGVVFLEHFDEEAYSIRTARGGRGLLEKKDSSESGNSANTAPSSTTPSRGGSTCAGSVVKKGNNPSANENWRKVNHWRKNFARMLTSDRPGTLPDRNKIWLNTKFFHVLVAELKPVAGIKCRNEAKADQSFRILYRGEVDCLDSKGDSIQLRIYPSDNLRGHRFESKSLLWYIQARLTDCSTTLIGVHGGQGVVNRLRPVPVDRLRQMSETWQAPTCLAFLNAFLRRLKSNLEGLPEGTVVAAEYMPGSRVVHFSVMPEESGWMALIDVPFAKHFSDLSDNDDEDGDDCSTSYGAESVHGGASQSGCGGSQ